MTPETIAAAAAGLGIAASSIWGGWQSVQAKREAKAAGGHASTAADNSKPVSNGFTKEVRDGMAEILTMATDARNEALLARELGEANRDTMTRHLEAHANSGMPMVRSVAL